MKPLAAYATGMAQTRTRVLAARDMFGACEQRLASESGEVPTLAIVGASYTAGVGPGMASLSWAAVLARMLRWNSVIYGVPGAGYVATGPSDLGPILRMVRGERLRRLNPGLVVVQAGHDDSGVPARAERRAVIATIEEIRRQDPHARIALLTVFTRPRASDWLAYYRTDQAIVAAARAADPNAIIMDPLTSRWTFARSDGTGLHPSAAGDAEIARRVAVILRSRGITAAGSRTITPLTCQASVGVGIGSTAGPPRVTRDD